MSAAPRIVSRTRLSPTKEIHVVQIGQRQLVIGSTAQQMTLLTELLPDSESVSPSVPVSPPVEHVTSTIPHPALSSVHGQAAYQKYLLGRPPALKPPVLPTDSIPNREEVVLLNDYNDQYESHV
jgi:hypothetical protein